MDKIDSDNESHLSSRKLFAEIQNVSTPLKRKNENLLELAKSVKLKFVKCENITINITKE
jgi:hypothetical protein